MKLAERARSILRSRTDDTSRGHEADAPAAAEATATVKAVWNGTVLAESAKTIVVEGNYYFPPDAVSRDFLVESDHHTACPWKGLASYYNVVVDGKENRNAAWHYPEPKNAARHVKGYVAFWKGVRVS